MMGAKMNEVTEQGVSPAFYRFFQVCFFRLWQCGFDPAAPWSV
jgi:hypothetical protein